jgi:1-pyrroline-5-carboxylate dehydrogenase
MSLEKQGLPDGVINMVFGDPEMITNTVLESPDFAGIHYTGSTTVFKNLWGKIGTHIDRYRSYPRIVGRNRRKRFYYRSPFCQPKRSRYRDHPWCF